MEERKRGYQGRRLAGATPRQEPERRGSRTRQAEDKARRERDPWEMTSEETAPITPVDGESVSAGRRAASVAGGKAAPVADFDSMSGSADGTSADHAAGAVGAVCAVHEDRFVFCFAFFYGGGKFVYLLLGGRLIAHGQIDVVHAQFVCQRFFLLGSLPSAAQINDGFNASLRQFL